MDAEKINTLADAKGGDNGGGAVTFTNWQAEEFFKKGLAGMADENGQAKLFKGADITEDGKIMIKGFTKADAGIKDNAVHDVADMEIALLNKHPGEKVSLKNFRKRNLLPDETLEIPVELSGMRMDMMMPPGHHRK